MKQYTVIDFQFGEKNAISVVSNLRSSVIHAESPMMSALKIARSAAVNIQRKLNIIVTFLEHSTGFGYVGYIKKSKNSKGEYFYFGQIQRL